MYITITSSKGLVKGYLVTTGSVSNVPAGGMIVFKCLGGAAVDPHPEALRRTYSSQKNISSRIGVVNCLRTIELI